MDENVLKVYGWAADKAGCGYYRIGLPMWQLRNLGIFCQAHTLLPASVQREADIIVGQRICLEGPTELWGKIKETGRAKLVFELDDDLWNVHPKSEKAHEFFQKTGRLDRLNANIGIADLVTVSTEPLAEVVRQYNDNVIVIPNYIDAETLKLKKVKRKKLTIGWSGSSTHRHDFDVIGPFLEKFFRRNPQVDMHFIGQSYAPLIKTKSRHTLWSTEVADYHRSIDFDIGIIPLAPDRFNQSKSYIKALEYAALGIPCVVSDYGPYPDFVEHGVTGFLVKYDHEWAKYLRILVEDESLRKTMGEAARKHAEKYTIQNNGQKWLDAYLGVMAGRKAA